MRVSVVFEDGLGVLQVKKEGAMEDFALFLVVLDQSWRAILQSAFQRRDSVLSFVSGTTLHVLTNVPD